MTDRAPAVRMTEQPCFAIYGAGHAITRAYRALLDPVGLTYPQYVVMMLLWENDGVDQRTLAERARLDPATLTPLLRRLEEKSYLRRGRSAEDERRMVITVTPEGRALWDQVAHVPDAILCQAGLTEPEAATLIALCDKMIDSIGDAQ